MRPKKSPRVIRYPKARANELILDPLFQSKILKLRKKWKIPDEGLITNDEREEWEKWIVEESDKYLDSREFYEEEKALKIKRNRLSYEQYSYREQQEDWRRLNSKVPINEFKEDVLALRQSLNLSDYWNNFLEHYLKFNETFLTSNVSLQTRRNERTKERELYIRVWEHTGLEDIEVVWDEVKILKEKIPGFKGSYRERNLKIVKRNYEILEMYRSGITKPEKIRLTLYNKHFDEEDDIYNLSSRNISRILSDFRKKRELK